jgi:hypothetical protein
MGAPSQAQLAALKALFGAAPDTTLRMLDKALAGGGSSMAVVRDMIAEERADRSLREVAFGPVSPLFSAREFGPVFPARMAAVLWAALKSRQPGMVSLAAEETRYLRDDDPSPPVLDDLCRRAVRLLRDGDASVVRPDDQQIAEDLAAYLELAPLARPAVARLPEWLGRVSEDRTAALKIAMRDASALMGDGAPRLLEIFQAHLPEPQLLLRIISVATDRASDRYLAVSEMALFGERLLDDVDRRVEQVRTFDPARPAAAASLGDDITRACAILAEFDRSFEITRDGPWGQRVTNARRKLAANVEARLRDIEQALTRALPTQKVKIAGRMTRPAPCLDRSPDAAAVAQSQGLFAFLEATRAAAQVGGYGALRAQVAEKLRERLADYVDEVLHELPARGVADQARGQAFLELAAEFIERADDPKAAQLVRRRAAAAAALPPAAERVA